MVRVLHTAVGLEKLSHPPQVACRKPAPARVTPLDVFGQGTDGALPPGGNGDLVTDVFAEFPCISRSIRVVLTAATARAFVASIEGQDFVELRLRWRRSSRSLDGGFTGAFLGCFAHVGFSDRASKEGQRTLLERFTIGLHTLEILSVHPGSVARVKDPLTRPAADLSPWGEVRIVPLAPRGEGARRAGEGVFGRDLTCMQPNSKAL